MEKNNEIKAYWLHNRGFIDYILTHKFLNNFKKFYAKQNNLSVNDLKLTFISFGYNATIFVLNDNNSLQTVNVGSPHLKYQTIKHETQVLQYFNTLENSIIAPSMYYTEKHKLYKRELFVSPYIFQARAISNLKGKFGIYIPEPVYRFEETSPEQTTAIKKCIIAKLIASYDQKNNLGIGGIEIISGDFIMKKDWEKQTPTLQNTYDNMNLISIRNIINCSLNDYIEIIKQEFTQSNSGLEYDFIANPNYQINTCSEIPFTHQEIEEGINLGLEKLNQKTNNKDFKDISISK